MAARAFFGRLTWGALGLALLGSACVSPTIPLPPPDAPLQISAAAQAGFWQLRGECLPGATVLVKNEATSLITGVEDSDRDGRYLITIQANACDVAELREIIGTTTSTSVAFLIEPTINGTPSGSTCK